MKIFIAIVSILLMTLCAYATPSASEKAHRSQNVDRIELNTVNERTLSTAFKGIGKRRAAAIIAYRTKHGAFASIGELANVQSVGKAFVNQHLSELEKVFYIEANHRNKTNA